MKNDSYGLDNIELNRPVKKNIKTEIDQAELTEIDTLVNSDKDSELHISSTEQIELFKEISSKYEKLDTENDDATEMNKEVANVLDWFRRDIDSLSEMGKAKLLEYSAYSSETILDMAEGGDPYSILILTFTNQRDKDYVYWRKRSVAFSNAADAYIDIYQRTHNPVDKLVWLGMASEKQASFTNWYNKELKKNQHISEDSLKIRKQLLEAEMQDIREVYMKDVDPNFLDSLFIKREEGN